MPKGASRGSRACAQARGPWRALADRDGAAKLKKTAQTFLDKPIE